MTRVKASPFISHNSSGARTGVASWLGAMRLHLDQRMRRASRDESGSAIVEFAVTSTILFTLLIGVTAICLALYSYNVVSEIAREATRYAIVRGSACNSFPDCNIDQTGLQTYVQGLGFPGINPAALTVAASATVPVTFTTCTGTLKPCNTPGSAVQVKVTYTFPVVIPFVPSRTLTMSSTSQMVISQ
jgi:Flp pilus assembly protein TadG